LWCPQADPSQSSSGRDQSGPEPDWRWRCSGAAVWTAAAQGRWLPSPQAHHHCPDLSRNLPENHGARLPTKEKEETWEKSEYSGRVGRGDYILCSGFISVFTFSETLPISLSPCLVYYSSAQLKVDIKPSDC